MLPSPPSTGAKGSPLRRCFMPSATLVRRSATERYEAHFPQSRKLHEQAKRLFLKFAGHFHGWNDFVIPGADPPYDGAVPGVPREVAADTVIVPPNDPDAVERALANDPQIGCVILEPTGGHFGAVPMRGEFLRALRDVTSRHGRLLIFDEVISGFRVHPGGAQGHYGVKPDLTTLAKILAGGLPGGWFAGGGRGAAAAGVPAGEAEKDAPRPF